VKAEAELIRLAIAPDGALLPDVSAKLPGRGIWVSADRAAVERALKKGLFNRTAGMAVDAPSDLAARIEAALEARALSLLGLARRAGELAVGFDAARLALKAGRPAWRIEAADGAADGRGKLDRLAKAAWGAVPVAGCFGADALGSALGRSGVVHAVLAPGAQARGLGETLVKLSGFREIDPAGTAG
jgi:predicted RNA-binding protein YlxR (DUF448 family)